MCGHNLCNVQSALPRCAPRVLSLSAGPGGAGQGLLFARRGGAGQPVFPRGGVGRASLIQILPFLPEPYICIKMPLACGLWIVSGYGVEGCLAM